MMSGTNTTEQGDTCHGGVCTDCGLSLYLDWRPTKEVRRASLNLIEEWDSTELEPEDIPATGSLHLTTDGWKYGTLSPDEAEAMEKVRVNEWEVNRRTICYRELIVALLGHARAWLCHGGIDIDGQRMERALCRALEPTALEREWDRAFSSTTSFATQSVTMQQMRDLIHNVDSVVLQEGLWTASLPVETYTEIVSWRKTWEVIQERDANDLRSTEEREDDEGMA